MNDIQIIRLRDQNYSLRPLIETDIPPVRCLVNAAYKELADLGLNFTATYQDEQMTRDRVNKGRAFVLEKKSEIVGTVIFTKENHITFKNSGYISQLAIHPSFKKMGLGTVLMDHCEAIALLEGYEAVQLDTAKPAKHLVDWYLKRGYQIVGEKQWSGKTYQSWIFEKPVLIKNQIQRSNPAIFSRPPESTI